MHRMHGAVRLALMHRSKHNTVCPFCLASWRRMLRRLLRLLRACFWPKETGFLHATSHGPKRASNELEKGSTVADVLQRRPERGTMLDSSATTGTSLVLTPMPDRRGERWSTAAAPAPRDRVCFVTLSLCNCYKHEKSNRPCLRKPLRGYTQQAGWLDQKKNLSRDNGLCSLESVCVWTAVPSLGVHQRCARPYDNCGLG